MRAAWHGTGECVSDASLDDAGDQQTDRFGDRGAIFKLIEIEIAQAVELGSLVRPEGDGDQNLAVALPGAIPRRPPPDAIVLRSSPTTSESARVSTRAGQAKRASWPPLMRERCLRTELISWISAPAARSGRAARADAGRGPRRPPGLAAGTR